LLHEQVDHFSIEPYRLAPCGDLPDQQAAVIVKLLAVKAGTRVIERGQHCFGVERDIPILRGQRLGIESRAAQARFDRLPVLGGEHRDASVAHCKSFAHVVADDLD
jgi:hypothetical protein